MSKKLYVGGLPYAITDERLEDVFAEHGTVESARVITDRDTGRSRGFGFVEMETQEEAQSAISALDGTDLEGRTLTVNEARPRENRSGGFGGGGGGGRGGGRWELTLFSCLSQGVGPLTPFASFPERRCSPQVRRYRPSRVH